MKRMLLIGAMVAIAGASMVSTGAVAAEKRCGWLVNPTPANFYLQDSQASWWLMTQGGPSADGFDDHLPAFDEKQYVELQPNGYGYGCACLTVDVDRKEERVTRLYDGKILPLAQCQKDSSLPAVE